MSQGKKATMLIWGEPRSEIGGYGKAILFPVVTSDTIDLGTNGGWSRIKIVDNLGGKLHVERNGKH